MNAVAPRWAIPSAEAPQALVAAPLPLGLRAGPARRSFLRDLYFDTPAGDLRRRDVACRVCFAADDRRTLVLEGLRPGRSEEHTSELQSRSDLVCRLLLEKKK